MQGSKGLHKSAATVRIKCNVPCEKIYPKDGSATVGFHLTKAQAVALTRNILALVSDPEIKAPIIVTAHKKTSVVGVLGTRVKRKLS